MNIGKLIYGYCNGYFGRDSYDTKRIEAEGWDWIVARELDENSRPEFAQFNSEKEKQERINEWSVKPKDYIG